MDSRDIIPSNQLAQFSQLQAMPRKQKAVPELAFLDPRKWGWSTVTEEILGGLGDQLKGWKGLELGLESLIPNAELLFFSVCAEEIVPSERFLRCTVRYILKSGRTHYYLSLYGDDQPVETLTLYEIVEPKTLEEIISRLHNDDGAQPLSLVLLKQA